MRDFHAAKHIPHLQHKLIERMDVVAVKALKQRFSHSQVDKSRIRAAKQSRALHSLVKPPINNRFGLTNVEYLGLLRQRFGFTPVALCEMPVQCACGIVMNDAPFDHLITCPVASKRGHHAAHNALRDVVFKLAEAVNWRCRKEPVYPGFTARPDAEFIDNMGKLTIVDVSCVQPTAASYARQAAARDLAAADQRDRVKQKIYQSLANEIHAAECAFVVVRFGGVNKSGSELINEIARQSKQFMSDEADAALFANDDVAAVCWEQVMKSVYQGNSILVRNSLQCCVEARLHRVCFRV